MSGPARLDDVRQVYNRGLLLPFVGAGLSMSIVWTTDSNESKRGPSWGGLVDEACRQMGFEDPALLRARGEDLQILEYFRALNDGRMAKLTNWMVRDFAAPDVALKESVLIQALAEMTLCRTFYTTNFDDYLERGLEARGRKVTAVATEAEAQELITARATDAEMCEVVKFHGDLAHPEAMVLTESDYRRRLALEGPMDDRLRSDMLGRTVLFLGYSFRDWNVSYLFHVVEQVRGPMPRADNGRRAYVIVADPSDFEIRLFAERGIGVLGVPSGLQMTDAVATILLEIAS